MADPEEIYAEVLAEEQGKGVSPAVAEGRAKAARSRAEAGSPHPKEAKWWPGAQPHLETGDGAAAEAPAEEVTEAAPEEAPAAEEAPAPAAEAPAEAPAAQAPAEAPAEEAPAEAPAAEAPPAPEEPAASPTEPLQPAAATAAAPTATVAPARPSGVMHGTESGTRLRPEDSVTTEAQFQGQQAMYDRRKLIDELVGTGVPAVAAADTGRRSPVLALMYLLIPIAAIAFVFAQGGSQPAGGGEDGGGAEDSGVVLTAAGVQFDTDQVSLPADEETTVTLHNEDSVEHNFSIYTDDSAEEALFEGRIIAGGASVDYDVPALEAGEHFFRCDVHPTAMVGTVTVE